MSGPNVITSDGTTAVAGGVFGVVINSTDISGNPAAIVAGDLTVTGTITGAVSGAATQVVIVDDTTTNATVYPTWVTAATGNLPEKVSSTKLSFNPSTGVLSVTSIAVAGAIAFNAASANLTGDFTNATPSLRNHVQTSTTNGTTSLSAIPNGSGTTAAFTVENNSVVTNAGTAALSINATEAVIQSTRRGSGTTLPLHIKTGDTATTRISVDALGNIVIGSSAALTIGAYGSAGVAQPAAIANATDAASAITQLNLALAALRSIGWIAT